MNNYINVTIPAINENESLARSIVAAFAIRLNPTLDEIADIKTAVSEAVTNSVVHGYPDKAGDIYIYVHTIGNILHIEICDDGIGINDIENARRPFYSTKAEQERSGMGFTVMESFMDKLLVENRPSGGLKVTMSKFVGRE